MGSRSPCVAFVPEYGYGSTIAVILTALCLVFTLAIFRSSRSKAEV